MGGGQFDPHFLTATVGLLGHNNQKTEKFKKKDKNFSPFLKKLFDWVKICSSIIFYPCASLTEQWYNKFEWIEWILMILLNSCELMCDDCVTADENFDDEGRVWLPNRMNFRKSAKGRAGVHFQSKIYIGDFGPL